MLVASSAGGVSAAASGTTQELQVVDGEFIDLEPPLEQREPAPDEPHRVDLEPRTVAIGQHDVADRRVGGQRAVDGADETLVDGEDSACEIRLASTPLSSSAARAARRKERA